MDTTTNTTEKKDLKVNVKLTLSALWAVLMFLYIYADILSLHKPGQVEEIISGRMGPLPVTQGSLLIASILMLIPAVMVCLSLMLKQKVDRWANIVLGVLYTVVNIGNLVGETRAFYIFFGLVELALTLLIIWQAWQWRNPEGQL